MRKRRYCDRPVLPAPTIATFHDSNFSDLNNEFHDLESGRWFLVSYVHLSGRKKELNEGTRIRYLRISGPGSPLDNQAMERSRWYPSTGDHINIVADRNTGNLYTMVTFEEINRLR